MFFRNVRFVLVGFAMVGILGFLIYTASQQNMVYYYTASELLADPAAQSGKPVRLGGRVVAGTIQKDPQSLMLTFSLRDEATSIPVRYTGVVPDTFQEEADGIVEGTYREDGIFYASTLLAKCPSKYERRE